MKLFIEESVYKDQNISVYGLSVYCALKTLIVTEEDKNIYERIRPKGSVA